MDFITHSLVGAGVARLACPKKEWLPQLTLAGILGSTLMDGDSWIYFLGPNAYGFFHRKLTHNVFALVVLVCVGAALTRAAGRIPSWRRFGWFLAPDLPAGSVITRPPWGRLLIVGTLAAVLHDIYDIITGFGNITLFWPLSDHETTLAAVYTLDYFILGLTLSWNILTRNLDWPRRKEAWITAAYFLAMTAYVGGRWMWHRPSSF